VTDSIQTLLRRNLHEVFGMRDTARRRAAIEALYDPAATFVDHGGTHAGWDAIDAAAAAVQAATPGFIFAEDGDAQVVGDLADGAGRVAWTYGPAEDKRRVTGADLVLVRNGRILALSAVLHR
jgi:hypothetical protein